MVCEFCTTDAQCADHGAFICGEQGDGEHEESEPGFDGEKGARHCARLPLFDDFPVDDMYASVAVFIGGVLAAGGGLGGGGMFVPFFILVAHLRTHEAIPLSQATIFGGGCVNFLMNFKLKHPKVPARPLIQYDAVLMLEPMMLAGTVIGAYLNAVFPGWLIVTLLVVFLTYSTYRTSQKAKSIWRKERAAQEAANRGEDVPMLSEGVQDHSFSGDLTSPRSPGIDEKKAALMLSELTDARNDIHQLKEDNGELRGMIGMIGARLDQVEGKAALTSSAHPTGSGSGLMEEEELEPFDGVQTSNNSSTTNKSGGVVSSSELAAITAAIEERDQATHGPLIWALSILILISVLSLMRGGKAGMTSVIGVEACSGSYFFITFLSFAVMIGATCYFASGLVERHNQCELVNYPTIEGDIVWNQRNCVMYPVLACAAGAMGGMLGIGGGMIMGPLLLELGMLAETTAATSATTVLLTAASGTFQESLLGMMLVQRGFWYFFLGAFSTWIGQVGVNHIVRKYKMSALIVVMVVVVMFLSMIMMSWVGLVEVQNDLKHGNDMGFASFCT